jgi:hypothetical protein
VLWLWDAGNLDKPLSTLTIDVSPGLLAPYYDEDTGVLFVYSRVRGLHAHPQGV